MEKAFQFAFANIKKTDGVIVGMFPILSDEIGEDADLARKYAWTRSVMAKSGDPVEFRQY